MNIKLDGGDLEQPKPVAQTKNKSKHKKEAEFALRKLFIVSILWIFFMTLEFIGGYIANSIAIMSDAAHLLSDFSGFLISMFSIWIGTMPATGNMSFGYHRAEVIGALASILLIWGLTAWLVTEAIARIINPTFVDGKIMLITATLGFIVTGYFIKKCNSISQKLPLYFTKNDTKENQNFISTKVAVYNFYKDMFSLTSVQSG